jgi:hypothetical protein
MEFICVKCANTDVRKVSAVVREGTWKAKTHGESWGYRRDHKGRWRPDPRTYSETHTRTTELADLLAPPDEPWAFAFPPQIFFWLAIAAAWFLTPSLGAFLVVLLILCWLMGSFNNVMNREYKRSKERAQAAKEEWRTQMKNWNQLCYCGRCDTVFNPETGQSAPVNEMGSLL